MHDLKAIRDDAAAFAAAMRRRGITGPEFPGYPAEGAEHPIMALDRQRRDAQTGLQTHETRRNELARAIGQAKRGGEDTTALEAEGAALRQSIETANAYLAESARKLDEMLAVLPNILDADVPDGPDESANAEQKQVGAPPAFDFAAKQHFELGEALGLMDFTGAAKLAGARFTVLRGDLARLERALGQFMLDLHVSEHGYTEVSPPLLVNDATMYGTGQLPKFAEDLFRTTDGRWLIPTAEVPLTNLAAGEILDAASLPLRMTALTPSFRSEAGSAGRDTRGMLRQHQFWKVELVSLTTPEASADEHERMTRCAETVLERLGLPYRRMLLCSGDTGFSSAKTYDLEVWMPGQGTYREISSCSNCRGFQARRMNARYRPVQTGPKPAKPDFVHTLNGSGVATGRALIAVMETYQNADGSITIPEALRPYMGGRDRIG
ncbi:MAG TPA: serine--tRNA ligase [Acidiphilium sp.]|uniref:serine--tRNA ligase n=1 Tax=unclassified Acidiphilium TaxID=2617493 RepID=UPI000BC4A715|nr:MULTISPECIES: serine--tRNA ligase [unclassified Acidiphilium]OYV57541.1 MAG: serine--tRNA ligase [Acidiphilium sp. 20-67-58]HQT59580.1 serine--tRNA ligase [Acidiphilium sp.]HQU10337.1 serine--tRNA ligase [Acidiphilium sp.]